MMMKMVLLKFWRILLPKGKVNNTLSSMGSTIKRPSGIKQAKANLKDDRTYDRSVAKSDSAIGNIAHDSNDKIANTMEERTIYIKKATTLKEMKVIKKEEVLITKNDNGWMMRLLVRFDRSIDRFFDRSIYEFCTKHHNK